jgi:hypothetical protein
MPATRLLVTVFLIGNALALGQGRPGDLRRTVDGIAKAQRNTPSQVPQASRNYVQLSREAQELSNLARGIPAEVDNAGYGVLSKDTLDKLKRSEKLSKHLRAELAR